ncbi:hypothetical protein DAEQUDRAFT_100916 [Daedalea quercina L-15889]|uniref:Uncharacterized protein n=1 Tax=Daedalea quercina L-15889 TaxID=1314783 RepID=A0A165KW35_9APHY|nr:hypothetical protein DAEQUDRAFT_100916 [Daedalea quercina L-15889]
MPGPKTRKKISVPADGSAQPKAARTGKGRKTTKASSPAPVTDVNTVDMGSRPHLVPHCGYPRRW